jgi:RHS repeat-associated protein
MAMSVVYTTVAGRVVHENRGGAERFYGQDPLGSTAALYDEAGNKTDEWEYWPYGEVRSHTGSSPTPLTFVGTLGYFMDSARQYYVRARSYRADLGRWTTVDPLWPQESPYGYVGGMPTGRVDPSGSFAIIPVACAVACGGYALCLYLCGCHCAVTDLVCQFTCLRDCRRPTCGGAMFVCGVCIAVYLRYVGCFLGAWLVCNQHELPNDKFRLCLWTVYAACMGRGCMPANPPWL